MWQVECAKSSYSFYLQTPRAQTFSISERWHLCWQFSVQIRVYLDFVLRGRFTSEWCDVLCTVGWRELRCCRGTLSVSLRSHCNWKNLLFFLSPLSFFQLLIHPLWVQRSQVIIVQRPERKMRLGGGGERGRQGVGGGGLECLCDTEREKQTEKEEERRLCVRFTS